MGLNTEVQLPGEQEHQVALNKGTLDVRLRKVGQAIYKVVTANGSVDPEFAIFTISHDGEKEEPKTEIDVYEGKVIVQEPETDKIATTLEAGQRTILLPGKTPQVIDQVTPASSRVVDWLATLTVMPTPTPTATPACDREVDEKFDGVWESELGCPLGEAQYDEKSGTWQSFDRGYMLWRDIIRKIYVLFEDDRAGGLDRGHGSAQIYEDTWWPTPPPPADPQNEYTCGVGTPSPPQPIRGFGKVWCDEPDVKEGLGKATVHEKPAALFVQEFDDGIIIWLEVENTDYYYVVFAADRLWKLW